MARHDSLTLAAAMQLTSAGRCRGGTAQLTGASNNGDLHQSHTEEFF